ncbi:MAG: cell wall hydrolase, partial [Anaerolineales bacterium]
REGRSEPPAGQLAIAFVTIRRAEQNKSSICFEVFRYRQFSWTSEKRYLQALPSGPHWQQALRTAALALAGFPDNTMGATHYHAVGITPRWAKSMHRITRIGNHIFYRPSTHEDRTASTCPAPAGLRVIRGNAGKHRTLRSARAELDHNNGG